MTGKIGAYTKLLVIGISAEGENLVSGVTFDFSWKFVFRVKFYLSI